MADPKKPPPGRTPSQPGCQPPANRDSLYGQTRADAVPVVSSQGHNLYGATQADAASSKANSEAGNHGPPASPVGP